MRRGIHYTITGQRGERPIGDRFLVPERFTVRVDDPSLACLIELDVDNTGPQPVCVEVRAKQRPEGPPMSGAILRSVRLGTYLRDSSEFAVATIVDQTDWRRPVSHALLREDETAAYRHARTPGARRITDEDLARVADVYRQALRLGQPPTAEVQQRLKLRSRAQAARWVSKARRAGFLGLAPGHRLRGERLEEGSEQ